MNEASTPDVVRTQAFADALFGCVGLLILASVLIAALGACVFPVEKPQATGGLAPAT